MLTSAHPSLSSPILEQCSVGETSYRSYQEVSYASQSDIHNELQAPLDRTLLRIYDEQVDDIVTVLVDVVMDISLYSVTRNDETIHHTEVWNNAFMNRLLSETAQITARGSPFPMSAPTCVDSFVIISRAHSSLSILSTSIFILYMSPIILCPLCCRD